MKIVVNQDMEEKDADITAIIKEAIIKVDTMVEAIMDAAVKDSAAAVDIMVDVHVDIISAAVDSIKVGEGSNPRERRSKNWKSTKKNSKRNSRL